MKKSYWVNISQRKIGGAILFLPKKKKKKKPLSERHKMTSHANIILKYV